MTPRKTPEERLAEAVAEMGVEDAEKHFRFIKSYNAATLKAKQGATKPARTAQPTARAQAAAPGGKAE
jgi:hypothetical protein